MVSRVGDRKRKPALTLKCKFMRQILAASCKYLIIMRVRRTPETLTTLSRLWGNTLKPSFHMSTCFPSSSLLFLRSVKPKHSQCHSFIHSGYFYSASSSPLLLRGAPDTAWILLGSFTPKHHRQLRVKDCPRPLYGG